MKTSNKIIKLFIEESKPKTIREIAAKIKSDYKITHTATQRLITKNVLIVRTIGKSSLCSLNENYFGLEILQAEYERKEDMLRNKNLRLLFNEVLAKSATTLFVWLLFGSTVKGRVSKNSDIDLVFVSNYAGFDKEMADTLKVLPLKLHTLFFTEEEFIRMKDSKKPNVIQEIIKKNIIMYGVEQYYNLKNA